MSSLPTTGESRQQLIRLLEEATKGETDALQGLLDKAPDAYAPLLRLLTQLDYTQNEARAHWEAILRHREDLSAKLGRPTSLQVAALDYFQTLKARSGFRRSWRCRPSSRRRRAPSPTASPASTTGNFLTPA